MRKRIQKPNLIRKILFCFFVLLFITMAFILFKKAEKYKFIYLGRGGRETTEEIASGIEVNQEVPYFTGDRGISFLVTNYGHRVAGNIYIFAVGKTSGKIYIDCKITGKEIENNDYLNLIYPILLFNKNETLAVSITSDCEPSGGIALLTTGNDAMPNYNLMINNFPMESDLLVRRIVFRKTFFLFQCFSIIMLIGEIIGAYHLFILSPLGEQLFLTCMKKIRTCWTIPGISFIVIFKSGVAWTIFLVLGFQKTMDVYTGKHFPMENTAYLIIGSVLICILYRVNYFLSTQIENYLAGNTRWMLPISLVFLFIFQVYICYSGFFRSDWDVEVVHRAAIQEVNNQTLTDSSYFSWYPNNLFLVWLYALVYKISPLFGCSSINSEFSIAFFQCIVDVLTIALIFRTTFSFTRNYKLSWFAFTIAYLFIGLSPWFIVGYSDATGIIFPILLIRVYQIRLERHNNVYKCLIWFLLGMVAMTGYLIKPQIIIVLFAIAVKEFLCLFRGRSNSKKSAVLLYIFATMMGIGVITGVYSLFIRPTLNIIIDPERRMGLAHYLAMGLNERTDGVFAQEDVSDSWAITTNKERDSINIKKAGTRIRSMGIKGLCKHLNRKQLVNYGDGTFAWAVEGVFFIGDPEWANTELSDAVRSYIKPNGENYGKFLSSKQMIWVILIFFTLFTPFSCYIKIFHEHEKSKQYDTILVMIISIIGLSVFELIFEARARYLFCYAPYYVILGSCGIRNFYMHFKRNDCRVN